MAYVVLKNEKTVKEIIGRAYGDLNAAESKRAEAALVRANPQLAAPRELKPGAVIVVPTVPGVRPSVGRRTETPAPEVVLALSDSLGAYLKQLVAADKDEQSSITGLLNLLKSKEMKTVRELEGAGDYVDRVAAAAKSRVAEQEGRGIFLKSLTKAKTDLEEVAKKLG